MQTNDAGGGVDGDEVLDPRYFLSGIFLFASFVVAIRGRFVILPWGRSRWLMGASPPELRICRCLFG